MEHHKTPQEFESTNCEDERVNEEEGEQELRSEHGEEELTDYEIDTLKKELLCELSELEWEFKQAKESLFNERISQVEEKLNQARSGEALEFQQVVLLVKETYKIRRQVAKYRMDFALEIANKELDNELQIAECTFKEQLLAAEEEIRLRLQENICKLQINRVLDRRSSDDRASEVDNYLPSLDLEPRKKPVTLSPSTPHLIYQLPDEDIESDISMILDAVKKHKISLALEEMNGGRRVY